MIVKTITVTPFYQNARIIIDESTGKGALVDPGGDIELIIEALDSVPDSMKLEIVATLLTHSHIDHCGGVMGMEDYLVSQGKPIPKLYGHESEQMMRGNVEAQLSLFGIEGDSCKNCREPDVMLRDGDVLQIGSLQARALFTPGHSPGHFAFYFAKPGRVSLEKEGEESNNIPILISGDALFAGAIGRTDLPMGDSRTLLRSIKDKLLTLPDDTLVLPGHGGNTTVDIERRTNPFLG